MKKLALLAAIAVVSVPVSSFAQDKLTNAALPSALLEIRFSFR